MRMPIAVQRLRSSTVTCLGAALALVARGARTTWGRAGRGGAGRGGAGRGGAGRGGAGSDAKGGARQALSGGGAGDTVAA
jgi:hypothetical protein